jgi:hypothetical protein
MAQRPHCVDCGATAPETTAFGTTKSLKLGWRLARRVLSDGTRSTMEWRCPGCWGKHRADAGRMAMAARTK